MEKNFKSSVLDEYLKQIRKDEQQLRKDSEPEIDPNIVYYGKDGRSYTNFEDAMAAVDPNIVYYGKDGRSYTNFEDAMAAIDPNIKQMQSYIKNDYVAFDDKKIDYSVRTK